MPSTLNDIQIQLDQFPGYGGPGVRRLAINLAGPASFDPNAAIVINSVNSSGPVAAVKAEDRPGYILVDLHPPDIMPDTCKAVIHYSVLDPNSNTPGFSSEGRVIISNLNFSGLLPAREMVFDQVPDKIDLSSLGDNMAHVYPLDPAENAGEITRCADAASKDCCCNEATKKSKARWMRQMQLSAMIPSENNSTTEADLSLGFELDWSPATTGNIVNPSLTPFNIEQDLNKRINKFAIDAKGSIASASAFVRLHAEIANLFIETAEDVGNCQPEQLTNQFNLQFAVDANGSSNAFFFLRDAGNWGIQKTETEAGISFNLNGTVRGGLTANNNGGNGAADINIRLDLHNGDHGFSEYTITGTLRPKPDNLDSDPRHITISGGGKIDTNLPQGNEFSADGTFTIHSLDAEDHIKDSTEVSLEIEFSSEEGHGRLVRIQFGVNNQENAAEFEFQLHGEGTSTGFGHTIYNGDLSAVFPDHNNNIEGASVTGAFVTTGPCLVPSPDHCDGPFSFIPKRNTGFWLNPGAAHKLAYVTQKGNWQQFGVLTLRRQMPGNDAVITATLPSNP